MADSTVGADAARDVSARQLAELLGTDRLATGVAVSVLLLISVTTSGGALAAALAAIVFAMALVRQIGVIPLRSSNTVATVWWFAIGSWGASIGVVLMVPIALPVMIVTMLIPAILSAIYHGDRETRFVMVALVVATAVVTAIGMWFDGSGLQQRIDETFVRLAIVGFVAGQVVPLTVAVRQASVRLQAALEDAERANVELRRSRERIVRAGDTERRRIERDLHDGAQQRLVSTLMQLRMTGRRLQRGDEVGHEPVEVLAGELEAAIDELRALARGIYPSLLQNRGLPDALAGLARAAPMQVTVTVDVDVDGGRLPTELEHAFYFVASEALQNVGKHAADASVRVTLATTPTEHGVELHLIVVDDGPGFEVDELDGSASTGLVNMTDRMGAIDGRVEVVSAAGVGCRVAASAPIRDKMSA